MDALVPTVGNEEVAAGEEALDEDDEDLVDAPTVDVDVAALYVLPFLANVLLDAKEGVVGLTLDAPRVA